MKVSGKRIFCVALCAVVMLQTTACASDTGTREPEVDTTEINSTVNDSSENAETENGETEKTELTESGFHPTASALVPMDYDAKVLTNRNDDGSKKYVASDVAPTICYDNLSLGFLTDSLCPTSWSLWRAAPLTM